MSEIDYFVKNFINENKVLPDHLLTNLAKKVFYDDDDTI